LRRHSERIRHAIEKRKHRRHVNGFRNLILTPTGIAQRLHIGGRRVRRIHRQLADVLKQRQLRRTQPRIAEPAFDDRRYAFFTRSLNTQEVGMRIQSIIALIQIRNVAGD